jgi:hypothetical protein
VGTRATTDKLPGSEPRIGWPMAQLQRSGASPAPVVVWRAELRADTLAGMSNEGQ